MSMQSTVLTRTALERVGMPDPKYKVASDYAWLALLCRAFAANMVNAPGTIKHEYAASKKRLAEGHLVTGKTALRFHKDMLQIFEDLFWNEAPGDPELCGIRAYRRFKIAEVLLSRGERSAALEHLQEATRGYRGLDAKAGLWFARLVPQDQLAGRAFVASLHAARLPARVARRIGRVTALPQGAPPPAPSPLVPAAPTTRMLSGPALRAEDVEVKVVRSRTQLAPFFCELAALNLVSRRPCPFSTPEFLSLTLEHDEFARPGDDLLFLLAYAGDRLIGYLPLRKTMRNALGIPYGRVESLSLGYRDRPYAVARAEDEAACVAAFCRRLREQERGWSALELTAQDAASAFHAIVDTPGPGYWARRRATDPNTTIPLPFENSRRLLQLARRRLPTQRESTLPQAPRRRARRGDFIVGAGGARRAARHVSRHRDPELEGVDRRRRRPPSRALGLVPRTLRIAADHPAPDHSTGWRAHRRAGRNRVRAGLVRPRDRV